MFIERIRAIGVEKWLHVYENREVYDGLSWKIKVVDSSVRVVSWGLNAYPGPNGEVRKSMLDEDATCYEQFVEAVRELVR